jgi:hypothetical protein
MKSMTKKLQHLPMSHWKLRAEYKEVGEWMSLTQSFLITSSPKTCHVHCFNDSLPYKLLLWAHPAPLSSYFIQPWLWLSKSLKILLGLWQAFYLKSAGDYRLILQLSVAEGLSSLCTGSKHEWGEVEPLLLLTNLLNHLAAKPLQEIRGGFCSIYRTIWASSKGQDPTCVFAYVGYNHEFKKKNALWFHMFSPLDEKVSRERHY